MLRGPGIACLSSPFVGRPSSSARLLLLFHRGAAAFERADAALGDDYLRAALATDVNFSQLVSHR